MARHMSKFYLKQETTKLSKVDYKTNHAYFYISGEPHPVGYLLNGKPVFWGFFANRFDTTGRTFSVVNDMGFTDDELEPLHQAAIKRHEAIKGDMYAKGIIEGYE